MSPLLSICVLCSLGLNEYIRQIMMIMIQCTICYRSSCCLSMTTGCEDGWPRRERGWPHLCGGQGGGQPDGHHPCPPGGLGHVWGRHLPSVPPDLLHTEHRGWISIIIIVILHTIIVSITSMWHSSCAGPRPTFGQIYSGAGSLILILKKLSLFWNAF